jgi:predicted 3-demethylubiquinone-9 3-methyltransferase (glyoxalase superfamily)
MSKLVSNPGGMKAMMSMKKLDIAALEKAGSQS